VQCGKINWNQKSSLILLYHGLNNNKNNSVIIVYASGAYSTQIIQKNSENDIKNFEVTENIKE
jgi:hypothetical protein